MTRLLICSLLITALVGCGPRAELAKDKVIAQIDKVLGELDVKRKSIEVKSRELQKDLDSLLEKRVETQVRLEQLNKKKAESESEINAIKLKLSKLRDLIQQVAAGSPIERNGKTYTAEDLKSAADELSVKFKNAESAAGGLATSIDALTRSLEFLKSQEKVAKDMMSKLNTKIHEIDSKKTAIDGVKQASAVAGEDKSIMDRISKLNKEIEEMDVEIETAMRVEEAKLTEISSQTSTADEILAEPVDLNTTMAELDALLGTKSDTEAPKDN